MANYLPFEWYRPFEDVYVLPNGRKIGGAEYRGMKRQHAERLKIIRDKLDAESAYDIYNHVGRHVPL